MELLNYLIVETEEPDGQIAPAEERNSFSNISDPDVRAREQAEARKRYYYTHKTELKSKTKKINQEKKEG